MTHAAPVRVFHLVESTRLPYLWRPLVIVEDVGPVRGRRTWGHDRALEQARTLALAMVGQMNDDAGRTAARLAL